MLPLQADQLDTMDDDAIQAWDQFILRFTKLQDSMGGTLFNALLRYLQEPYEHRPMIDKLNRLEQLGFVDNVTRWQEVRALRNQFSHDYPEDNYIKASYLNEAVATIAYLASILDNIASIIESIEQQGKSV
ncbi:hypothetical protein D5085_10430 [Ectothiorhodospiraceae bacterium BW-2]|nr:hypothetical protein D5085_10430 [Ectothiorhodospiraceae bacterium BW-2]